MSDFTMVSCTGCGAVFMRVAYKCPICGNTNAMDAWEIFFDELDHTHSFQVSRDNGEKLQTLAEFEAVERKDGQRV